MAPLFKRLYDPCTQATFTLDEGRYLFSVDCQHVHQGFRLTKLQFAILSLLFREHPQLVSYEELEKVLRAQKIAFPDMTRLHRKVSELRTQLRAFHPALEENIRNLRGVGYNLSASWCSPLPQTSLEATIFQDQALQVQAFTLSQLMAQGIQFTRKGALIKREGECVMDRSHFEKELATTLDLFNKTEKAILHQTHLTPTDMSYLRLQAYLANFRTYVGLSRISEYAITHEQWCHWFEQEIQSLYKKITDLLHQIEEQEKYLNKTHIFQKKAYV